MASVGATIVEMKDLVLSHDDPTHKEKDRLTETYDLGHSGMR